jgi:cytochrome b subunit of formate dehydrogenase
MKARVTAAAVLLCVLVASAPLLRAAGPACGDCHADQQQHFDSSVHGAFGCAACHAGAESYPHQPGVRDVNCTACHADVVAEYARSLHGRARAAGAAEAPTCANCHGNPHALVARDDPSSPVHPARLPETCGHCHANPELVTRFGIPVARPLEAYRQSVHARAVAAGRAGATCSDCHGSHGILPASDPASKVFRPRVPATCGACHQDIAAAYATSIHGQAAARGVRDAPVCTDCHGEHNILSPREPGSPVFATNIPLQTCGRCHNDVRLSQKYGLPLDKVPAYESSYHGLAARAGVQTVANCASCHGVHDILPSADPRSHVHPTNLPKTCGQCHAGAGTRFALGPVHVVPTEDRYAAVYYIRLIYLPLIYVLIGGMVLHNLLDFARKFRSPAVRQLAALPSAEERLSLHFRIAHGLVMVSFPVLVYTGFALTYPESWWAQPVIHWESSLGLRGWLHRIAATVLLGALGWHGVHLWRDPRARACLREMRPGLEDWHEFVGRLRYYFGMSTHPPVGIRISYIEKSEYLAFLWGTAIMALTGFLLWFENFALRWLPKWVLDASTAVHFYEAILASLAILVWHFYWVIFDPAVYPMDTAWWSGRSPASRAFERQPLESPSPDPPKEEKEEDR